MRCQYLIAREDVEEARFELSGQVDGEQVLSLSKSKVRESLIISSVKRQDNEAAKPSH